MDRALAEYLAQILKSYCPVKTGALKESISDVQGNEKEWVITIGNEDASINGTPTIEYARTTNFAPTLKVFKKGKRKDPLVPEFTEMKNPNYHWVNNAVKDWVDRCKLLIDLEIEDDDMEVDTE